MDYDEICTNGDDCEHCWCPDHMPIPDFRENPEYWPLLMSDEEHWQALRREA